MVYKSCIFTGHAHRPHLSMSCASTASTVHAQSQRVVESWIHTRHYNALQLSKGRMWATSIPHCYNNGNVTMVCGVCALESSSLKEHPPRASTANKISLFPTSKPRWCGDTGLHTTWCKLHCCTVVYIGTRCSAQPTMSRTICTALST